jgi:hypothetical protein
MRLRVEGGEQHDARLQHDRKELGRERKRDRLQAGQLTALVRARVAQAAYAMSTAPAAQMKS